MIFLVTGMTLPAKERELFDRLVSSYANGVAIVRLFQASLLIGARFGHGVAVARLPNGSTVSVSSIPFCFRIFFVLICCICLPWASSLTCPTLRELQPSALPRIGGLLRFLHIIIITVNLNL